MRAVLSNVAIEIGLIVDDSGVTGMDVAAGSQSQGGGAKCDSSHTSPHGSTSQSMRDKATHGIEGLVLGTHRQHHVTRGGTPN